MRSLSKPLWKQRVAFRGNFFSEVYLWLTQFWLVWVLGTTAPKNTNIGNYLACNNHTNISGVLHSLKNFKCILATNHWANDFPKMKHQKRAKKMTNLKILTLKSWPIFTGINAKNITISEYHPKDQEKQDPRALARRRANALNFDSISVKLTLWSKRGNCYFSFFFIFIMCFFLLPFSPIIPVSRCSHHLSGVVWSALKRWSARSLPSPKEGDLAWKNLCFAFWFLVSPLFWFWKYFHFCSSVEVLSLC